MSNNRIYEVNKKTESRLLRHGLTLMLDYDTTREYCGLACNESLAFAEVCTSNDTVIERGAILVSRLDDEINEKIDRVIEYIDSAGKNAISLKIDFAWQSTQGCDPVINMINKVEEKYGFTLAIGSVSVDEDIGRYQMNVLLQNIPSFLEMSKKHPIWLPAAIQENIGDLLETSCFTPPASREEVLDLLRTKSTYNRWSMLMLNALFVTIFEHIEGLNLIYAQNSKASSNI